LTGDSDVSRILTVPEHIKDYRPYLPTGNLYVSLPLVNPEDGSSDRINMLHMASRGLLEFGGAGERGQPFMAPWLRVNGRELCLDGALQWERVEHWIPRFSYTGAHGSRGCTEASHVHLRGTIYAPVGHRGFVYLLETENEGEEDAVELELGLHGWWAAVYQTIYTSRAVNANRHVTYNSWSRGPVFEVRPGTSLGALAVGASVELDTCGWHRVEYEDGDTPQTQLPSDPDRGELTAAKNEVLYWVLGKKLRLAPGERYELAFYWAIGQEPDGARTTVVDLARHGWQRLLGSMVDWLRERHHEVPGEIEGADRLTHVLNLNKYFNYFYAQGYTVDTEDLVLVTSRSPRYYVSAAFWARDALLWSFPALVLVDPVHARRVLHTAFTRYIKNVGLHSLYIDGSLLYPGFELDELVAYIIALGGYVQLTGDESVLGEKWVLNGVERVMKSLREKRHPAVALYETFLYPSDDPIDQPYVTYDNALVVRALRIAAAYFERWNRPSEAAWAVEEARRVEETVWEHCVVDGPKGPIFAWCVDPETGEYTMYDEPPGSLRMLPYYGFCELDHPVYQATVAWIFSEDNPHYYPGARFNEVGCPHTDEPFVMGLFNERQSRTGPRDPTPR